MDVLYRVRTADGGRSEVLLPVRNPAGRDSHGCRRQPACLPRPLGQQQPPSVTPPAPVRPIRSTTEIMPIRVTRPAPPPPEAVTAQTEDQSGNSFGRLPWPAEESATPPQFSAPEPPAVSEPELIRFTQPRSAHEEAPARTAEARATSYASVPFAAQPGSADASPRRSKISPVLIGAVIVALLAVGGIVWMLRSSVSIGASPATWRSRCFR